MKKLLPLSLTGILLAGCINTIPIETKPLRSSKIFSQAKALAADRLRDPEATRYKDEYTAYQASNGDIIVCGTLNAKNAMGGYVGYKPFYVRMRDGNLAAFNLPSASDDYGYEARQIRQACSDAATGNIMISS